MPAPGSGGLRRPQTPGRNVTPRDHADAQAGTARGEPPIGAAESSHGRRASDRPLSGRNVIGDPRDDKGRITPPDACRGPRRAQRLTCNSLLARGLALFCVCS